MAGKSAYSTALDRRPVTTLRGAGPQLASRLEKLGIQTVQDLLFHLPLRYEDRTRITPIGALLPGTSAVIEGEVQVAETVFRGRRSLLVRVADGSGGITLRFFHFNAQQAAGFVRGARLRAYGDVRRGPLTLEMIHPEYRLLSTHATTEVEEHLTPIYPATEGITQGRLRGLTRQALALLDKSDALTDWLPGELDAIHGLPGLREALHYVHRPPPDAPVDVLLANTHPAQQRLAFEELLAQQLSLRRLRLAAEQQRAPALSGNGQLLTALQVSLPFTLTGAQQRALDEVLADLARPRPMLRLVQGDVGSGKTIVAALAALRAVESSQQAAIMAPTELLAEQHYRNFIAWLEPLGVRVAWLAGKLKGAARAQTLATIADGTAQVVVGTHALFQPEVTFAALGLAVIDEQHRFGVHQRLALSEKGARDDARAHQLIMTATPIPRTLAMTAYADLDVSIIDELPPGRTPVQTVVLPESRRADIVARIHAACKDGQQAYWVCPLIEESELLQCQAAEETFAMLSAALPDLAIGLVHGRLRPAQKDRVMLQFKAGELQLLVATTVIEVGVDVPNASLMVIENAERLGLAQLHQLRGRVGRGAAQSSCVLLYRAPLSAIARERLAALRASNDGFVIAEQDMRLRGPGEVLGTRQTGLMQMRIADLVRDADLLPTVQQTAEQMLRRHPAHVEPLIRRWLGDRLRYAQA